MRTALLAMVLCVAAHGQTFVQAYSNHRTAPSNFTTITLTFGSCADGSAGGSNTTAGSGIIFYVRQSQSASFTVVSVSDSASQSTWAQASSYATASGDTATGAMFYIANSAALSSITVTFSGTVTTSAQIVAHEFSGMAASSPLDAALTSTLNSSNTNISSSNQSTLTTTNPNDVLEFCNAFDGTTTTTTAGAGYTIPANGNAPASGIADTCQYEVVSATQAGVSTSITSGTARHTAAVFAGFKAAPPAPSTRRPLSF